MPAILFVCTANRIRSPLAASILRRKLEANRAPTGLWQVESAGIWAEPDLPALGVAQQAANELGLDLSRHRARRVDELDLAGYDLILTMERHQRDVLRATYPAAARRILTLGEATTGYVFDIVDPPGHTAGAVRYTARELVNIVEQGWDGIRARLAP
jgi:protein-tyrosine phosphatase